MRFGHCRDLHQLTDTADPAGVGLYDIDYLLLDQPPHAPDMRVPFSGRDGDVDVVLHPAEGVYVIGRYGVFVEEEVELFERLSNDDGVFGVEPGRSVCVDHDVHIVADGLADGFDLIGGTVDPAGLYAGQALFFQFERPFRGRCVAVGADAVSYFAAKEVPDRGVERFALDVPQGHINGVDGARSGCAGHSSAHRRNEHLLPDPLDVHRVFTHDDRPEVFDGRLYDAGPAGAFANADDPFVGVDLDEAPVAGAPA